jgi:acyl-CoA synthetase (AMP-forming)/AMP-acid ligase II
MLLEMAADAYDDRVAIGARGRDDAISYAELRRLAMAVATELAAKSASTLAVACANSTAIPVALFGAAWAGISYAPLNYRLPEDALQRQLARLDPVHLVDTDGWLAALQPDHGEPTRYPDDPDRPAVILFTSGTSGEPKAALLHHDNVLAYILNTIEFACAGDDDALLLAAPPFHIAGVAAVLSSVYAGRRIVPLAQFTPESWLRAACDEGVTHAFVVPTMLARIVDTLERDASLQPGALTSLSYGGARIPAPVLERALALFPDVAFVNAYGLTETSSTIAVLGPDEHRAAQSGDAAALRRLGSAGRPVPGIDVEIIDDDDKPLPAGEPGRIRVRGAQVGGTYLDTAGGPDSDGWLTTGDVGYVDDDGYLYVEGRADDVIIKGGENISPVEVEDALLRHPAIAAAAVVGVPDVDWGETIGAMVTVGEGQPVPSRAELLDFVRLQLGSLKTPSTIEIRPELPATDTGKILRRVVRAELANCEPTQ